MMHWLTRVIGLAPEVRKTGAREAALFVFICAMFLTVFAMMRGPELLHAMSPVLIALWVSAMGFFGFAFNLKAKRDNRDVEIVMGTPVNPSSEMGGG